MNDDDKVTILINKFCKKAEIDFEDLETYIDTLDLDHLYDILDPVTEEVILRLLKTHKHGIEFFIP